MKPINPSPAEPRYPAFANSVYSDQLASEEANWSGSALFANKYMNLYQQSGSNNLTGWNLKWAWHHNLFSITRIKILVYLFQAFIFFAYILLFMQLFCKILSEMANNIDPDQTAPSESALFL